MTITLPDVAAPAPAPPDGARELLAFAAVTVGAYLVGALAFVGFFGLAG